jgi:hypothetical protein
MKRPIEVWEGNKVEMKVNGSVVLDGRVFSIKGLFDSKYKGLEVKVLVSDSVLAKFYTFYEGGVI